MSLELGAFCSKACDVKFAPNALLSQDQCDTVLVLCSDASRALQGSLPVWANCVDRPQTTGESASADVTAVTKFCVTSGIFKILRKRQSLYVSQLCSFFF